ncbi:sensor domain-containing diguanylate cyclase [Actinomarinicola tropica]|uniref:Diguanylate cyclase n=1 Tax=Actinomarinicola tropica TaxID=2789776 RepID=A0A5Q2RL74_9ACTN|nr:diguanylate cyclase [Actinomarinicola tropica]QGG96593.1 diguanylate cyclase [Actinomarinicola tropica]
MERPPTPSVDDGRSIDATLRRTFLTMAVAVVLAASISCLVAAVNLLVFQARVDGTTAVIRSARQAHEAILDSETALRAYLATGDPSFLGPWSRAEATIDADLDDVAAHLGAIDAPASLLVGAIEHRVAYERWDESWADPARELFGADGALEGPELEARLADGRALFDRYRAAQATFLVEVQERRDGALAAQGMAIGVAGGVGVVVAAAMLVLARRQRRRLREAVQGPIEQLTSTMSKVAAGDPDARPLVSGPAEIREVARGLDTMIESLHVQRTALAEREAAMSVLARRLDQILRMSKEISGTGNPRYVAESATTAALALSDGDRARLWVMGGDGTTSLLHDTVLAHGEPVPVRILGAGEGLVGAATAEARIVHEELIGSHHVAWPLVVGARVVGALEVELVSPPDEPTVEALTTLAVHTAAALESARLYSENAELARVDPLTRLANRRSFAEDLEKEAERSARYDRPLSLVMIDLDHFKRLNDNYGHPFGDRVLQSVAQAVEATVRNVDTAYRLGGEELAVLARETDLAGAFHLAERLRAAIAEALSLDRGDPTTVTASFGVAELERDRPDTTHLVAAADAALYAAKRDGRNRVAAA